MEAAGPNILLVGCGKMGGALLRRWQETGTCRETVVVEPSSLDLAGAVKVPSYEQIPPAFRPGIVVFAVKPQTLPDIISLYKGYAEVPALSIVAGKSLSFFEKHLGARAKIIRAMPNTPALIGKGITVACANKNISSADKEKASALLGAVGEILWVEKEELLNPVTALSGSGPAYVFLLMEVLAKAGVRSGLDPALAERLARQTVIGSALLADADKNISAAQLRQNVTSPGGTTQAALEVLMKEPAIQDLFDRALQAATKRAGELSA